MMHRKNLVTLFLMAVVGGNVACSASSGPHNEPILTDSNQSETKPMTMIGNRRRRLPPELTPIVADGVVYKELRQGNKLGYEQKGGFLVALDAKSQEMLWHLRVYEIHYIEGKETDVQEVFFTRMELLPGAKQILIENELEDTFVVDLGTRTVTAK